MKKIHFLLIYVLFQSCSQQQQKIELNKLNNIWGLAYYISPRYAQDGCSYRAYFFPVNSQVDTGLISDKSTLFDFRYKTGIRFYTNNMDFLYQLHTANSSLNNEHIIRDDKHIIYWSFMKLSFKSIKGSDMQSDDNFAYDTIKVNNNILKLRFLKLDRFIDVNRIYELKSKIQSKDSTYKKIVPYKKMPC